MANIIQGKLISHTHTHNNNGHFPCSPELAGGPKIPQEKAQVIAGAERLS